MAITKIYRNDNGSTAEADKLYVNIDGKSIPVFEKENLLFPFYSSTDEEFTTMVNAYYDGKITLEDVKSVWSVGDTREVSLSAIAASGTIDGNSWSVSEAHRAQTIEIQILDFNHDTLTTPINGKTKALITVDTCRVLTDANLADSNINGSTNTENGYLQSTRNTVGWKNCLRRPWCNYGFYNSLPNSIKSLVKPVNKLSYFESMLTTSDNVFLLSEFEMNGTNYYSFGEEGAQYELYKTAINMYKLPKWANDNSDLSSYYWLRSIRSNVQYVCIKNNGVLNYMVSESSIGIAPAFCI